MIVNHFGAALVLAAGAMAVAAARPASAEVLESSDSGFVVAHVVRRVDSPDASWARLVEPSAWWHPDHTWSGDAAGLRLEPRAGGCFCEALADGGSVEHLRVVRAAPGRMLRMTGGLGPLQALPVTGVLTFELAAEAAGGTTITLRYAVSGAPGSGLDAWAPAVDGVLAQQVARLAADESGPGPNDAEPPAGD